MPVSFDQAFKQAVGEAEAELPQRETPPPEVPAPGQPMDFSAAMDQAVSEAKAAQPRQEELGGAERIAASRLSEEPAMLQKFLNKRGFETKKQGGEIRVKQGGKFVPWDPEGFDVGDLFDLVPEAAELGVATLGGAAKVLGALGAPVTGGASLAIGAGLAGAAGSTLEGGLQAIEKVSGVREEFDPGRIATKGLSAAVVPGAGKLVEKAGKLVMAKTAKVGAQQAEKSAARKSLDAATKKAEALKARGPKTSSGGKAKGLAAIARKTPGGVPPSPITKEAASKALGVKGLADKMILLKDISRMAGGDMTPALRRAALKTLKTMAPATAKKLATAANKATEKAARGLGKAAAAPGTKAGGQMGASAGMEELMKTIRKAANASD